MVSSTSLCGASAYMGTTDYFDGSDLVSYQDSLWWQDEALEFGQVVFYNCEKVLSTLIRQGYPIEAKDQYLESFSGDDLNFFDCAAFEAKTVFFRTDFDGKFYFEFTPSQQWFVSDQFSLLKSLGVKFEGVAEIDSEKLAAADWFSQGGDKRVASCELIEGGDWIHASADQGPYCNYPKLSWDGSHDQSLFALEAGQLLEPLSFEVRKANGQLMPITYEYEGMCGWLEFEQDRESDPLTVRGVAPKVQALAICRLDLIAAKGSDFESLRQITLQIAPGKLSNDDLLEQETIVITALTGRDEDIDWVHYFSDIDKVRPLSPREFLESEGLVLGRKISEEQPLRVRVMQRLIFCNHPKSLIALRMHASRGSAFSHWRPSDELQPGQCNFFKADDSISLIDPMAVGNRPGDNLYNHNYDRSLPNNRPDSEASALFLDVIQ